MRRTPLAAWLTRAAAGAALLFAASPLCAYVIVLKDGSTVQAREKYKVQGNTALIVLPSGAQSTLPLAQIDVARTDASNASDFGSATVLRGPSGAPTPAPTPHKETLSDLLGQRRQQTGLPPPPPHRPASAPVTASAAAAAEAPQGSPARTPAGNVDFLRAPRKQVSRIQLATTLGEMLRTHGVANPGIFEGTASRRLLVEVTDNCVGAVFQAIAGTAQALLDFEAKQPNSIDALELFVATDHRARAGQFLITAERARELATKQIDLTGFYLKYVEF